MTANEFLDKYRNGADNIDAAEVTEAFISEMRAGADGKKSSIAMLPTYLYDGGDRARDGEKFILIDAGGTNFRSAIGHYADGAAVIENIETTFMPATRGALSEKQFYSAIAQNVKRLLPHAFDIGLCFSFPVKMTKDCDGVILSMPKGVDAPEIIGTKVGASVSDAIREIDGSRRRAAVLNDTVAALLGAKRSVGCAHVGYIYGTGTNICFAADVGAENVARAERGRMLINTECGNFDKFPRGAFETAVAERTDSPETYVLEKAVAGKYLAEVIKEAFAAAAREGLIEWHAPDTGFTLAELSEFLRGGGIGTAFSKERDAQTAKEIANGIIDRAAKLGAIANAAAAIFSGNDRAEIAAEGTTFYKLYGYRERFEKHLGALLSARGITYGLIKSDGNLFGALAAAAQCART